MKPLIGFLLVVSGVILSIPQINEALAYVEYNDWPVVQGILGLSCICIGLVYLIFRGKPNRSKEKVWEE